MKISEHRKHRPMWKETIEMERGLEEGAPQKHAGHLGSSWYHGARQTWAALQGNGARVLSSVITPPVFYLLAQQQEN